MSWEALTVKSKISFFNKPLALNLLRRFWPLWTTYFAAMIFSFPVNLLGKLHSRLNTSLPEIYGVNRNVLETCTLEFIITFAFAVFIAMAVFNYLHDTRTCGLMNSLPLRRETAYCTAFITGLVPMLAANLLAWAAAWIILAGTPNVIAEYMFIRLAGSLMCSTAFFGLAAFCAALTGNILVLPVLYGVMNIAAVLLEGVVEALLSVLVYGYAYDGAVLDFLSPVTRLFLNCGVDSTPIPGAADGAYTYSVPWLGYLAGFCIAGIVLAGLGLLIVRRRRMELAGDVVAVGWLRPAFKYCMAVGGALIFACAVYYCFFDNILYGVPAAILVIAMLPVGALIGWFGSEMLMQKTLQVFSKGWKQYAAVCCILMALALCAELDVMGYENYIPPLDEIDYVEVTNENSGHLSQPETLELYRQLHRKLIEEKNLLNSSDGNYDIEALNYYLKDGTHVCRLYRLPYSDDAQSVSDTAMGALDRLLNCPEIIAQRIYPGIPVTEESISAAYLCVENIEDNGNYISDTVRLSPSQAYELYTECIIPDAEDGTIGLRFASDTEETRLRSTNVWILIELAEYAGHNASAYSDYTYDDIYIELFTDSARTYKWITDNTTVEPIDGYLNIIHGKY